LGVPLELFVDANDAAYMLDDQDSVGDAAAKRVRLRDARTKISTQVSELLSKATDQGSLDVAISPEDSDRLYEFLISGGYLNTRDRGTSSTPRAPIARPDLRALLQAGFTGWIRSLTDSPGGQDPMFQPVGGMMQIPLAFQRVLGHRITFHAEVRTIRQTPER